MKSKIAITTITKDRTPKRNYLYRTLESMRKGGVFESEYFHSYTIFDDCSHSDYVNELFEYIKENDLPITIRTHEESLGSRINAAKAHSFLYDIRDEIEWGIVTEDDIITCSRFLESVQYWLEDVYNKDRIMYLIGAPRGLISQPKSVKGYYDIRNAFHGSQCYAMKPEYFKSSSDYLYSLGKGNAHDIRMVHWIKKKYGASHLYFRAATPSLVQHIGDDSLTNPKRGSKILFDFIGEDKKYQRKKK